MWTSPSVVTWKDSPDLLTRATRELRGAERSTSQSEPSSEPIKNSPLKLSLEATRSLGSYDPVLGQTIGTNAVRDAERPALQR